MKSIQSIQSYTRADGMQRISWGFETPTTCSARTEFGNPIDANKPHRCKLRRESKVEGNRCRERKQAGALPERRTE
jgi:hypothetical protein